MSADSPAHGVPVQGSGLADCETAESDDVLLSSLQSSKQRLCCPWGALFFRVVDQGLQAGIGARLQAVRCSQSHHGAVQCRRCHRIRVFLHASRWPGSCYNSGSVNQQSRRLQFATNPSGRPKQCHRDRQLSRRFHFHPTGRGTPSSTTTSSRARYFDSAGDGHGYDFGVAQAILSWRQVLGFWQLPRFVNF